MELNAEQITELGLTEENSPKVSSFIADQIATAKQGFDGKANTDAEAILEGALSKVSKDTGIARNQGEKVGDYIPRAWNEFNTKSISEVDAVKKEYNDKITNFTGDKDLISKITLLEGEKDGLLKKFADYDDIKGKAEKYNPLKEEYEANKIQVAFSLAKPNFPDTVNKYEAEAKWGEFKNGILNKYNVVFDDGKWLAVDKENPHRQKVLNDLATQDEYLSKLATGRQQNGTGTTPIDKIQIENVPFAVPKNVDGSTKTQLIKEYLTKTKGLNPMSTEYSKDFSKYNKLINDNILKTA